jgi:hypothetical protein
VGGLGLVGWELVRNSLYTENRFRLMAEYYFTFSSQIKTKRSVLQQEKTRLIPQKSLLFLRYLAFF